MAILVTGGAGFIGSHTVVELQNAGYDVVVLDNLSNASEKSLQRVERLRESRLRFIKRISATGKRLRTSLQRSRLIHASTLQV